jgi:hypothetical protein
MEHQDVYNIQEIFIIRKPKKISCLGKRMHRENNKCLENLCGEPLGNILGGEFLRTVM